MAKLLSHQAHRGLNKNSLKNNGDVVHFGSCEFENGNQFDLGLVQTSM